MKLLVAVGLAGALGASARYLIDGRIQSRWQGPFPMGTFAINVSGSLLLGIVTGVFIRHASAPADVKSILGTGFVGAYTTFSTLMYETFTLVRGGARRYAFANVVGTLGAATAAAIVGLWLGGLL